MDAVTVFQSTNLVPPPNVFVERMLASLKARITEGTYLMVQGCGFIYD